MTRAPQAKLGSVTRQMERTAEDWPLEPQPFNLWRGKQFSFSRAPRESIAGQDGGGTALGCQAFEAARCVLVPLPGNC